MKLNQAKEIESILRARLKRTMRYLASPRAWERRCNHMKEMAARLYKSHPLEALRSSPEIEGLDLAAVWETFKLPFLVRELLSAMSEETLGQLQDLGGVVFLDDGNPEKDREADNVWWEKNNVLKQANELMDGPRMMGFVNYSDGLDSTLGPAQYLSVSIPFRALPAGESATLAEKFFDKMTTRPGTIQEALAIVELGQEEIIAKTVHLMRTVAEGLQINKPRGAFQGILVRAARSFPWTNHCEAGRLLNLLIIFSDPAPDGETPAGVWPPEAAALPVAQWVEERKFMGGKYKPKAAVEAFKLFPSICFELGGLEGFEPEAGYLPPATFASLFLAREDMNKSRRRPFVAIDAGRPHHHLLTGIRDLTQNKKDNRGQLVGPKDNLSIGRVELLAPGRSTQLMLPIDGLHEEVIRALKDMCGAEGLRDWAAIQALLSCEGQRTGRVLWTLDGHLKACGYTDRNCRRLKVRARVARRVSLLSRLELAVYDKDGQRRERRPVIQVTRAVDAQTKDGWVTEAMDVQVNSLMETGGAGLEINRLLYSGVREFKTGATGRNYFPTSPELPKIDHARFPYAHALGLLLPIRFRLRLGKGETALKISGEKILKMGGIPYNPRRNIEAWDTLEGTLAELQRRECLGSWEWLTGRRTLQGILQLHPQEWALDRWRGVRQIEKPTPPNVRTGAELKAWRTKMGWTQEECGKRLGYNKMSIYLAEKDPTRELSPRLAASIRAV